MIFIINLFSKTPSENFEPVRSTDSNYNIPYTKHVHESAFVCLDPENHTKVHKL